VKKAIAALQKAQIAVGGVCLAIFLVSVSWQIIARFAGVAATWTEDVSLYSFIWAVFMGAAAMVWENRHFAFTSLSDNLKSRAAKGVLAILISALILFFAAAMLYYGILITRQFWNYRWVGIPSFKRGPVWLCLPVAGGTMAVYSLFHVISGVIGLVKNRAAGKGGK